MRLPYLFRIELDDELLLNWEVDLLARRHRANPRGHPFGVKQQPFRHASALDPFERVRNRAVLPAALPHGDDITGLDRERRNVDLPAVDHEMTVTNKLTRLRPRRGKSEAVGNVVQTPFEELQERLA